MKIMAVCSSGLGTSFMIELKVKEIMKDLGIPAEVGHADVGSVTSDMADLFICTKDLASSISFKNLVAIPNITDKVAMKDAIQNFLNR